MSEAGSRTRASGGFRSPVVPRAVKFHPHPCCLSSTEVAPLPRTVARGPTDQARSLGEPLCSLSSFLSGGGLRGLGRAGAPALRPPLGGGLSRFGGALRGGGKGGLGGQGPRRKRPDAKRGSVRGSSLSSNPASRAQGSAEAPAQEPRTNSRHALGSEAGWGGLGDWDCVCNAPRSTAGIGCVALFVCLFCFARNKCLGVCKALDSPEAA